MELKQIPTWSLDEVKSSTHCGHTPMVRILDGTETEEELVGELTSFAPLLLVAPPYPDIKEAWNSAVTIEHILAKIGGMDVDIAVPVVAPKRDDRIALVGRCSSHDPPFMLALRPEIEDQAGTKIDRFTQFAHLRHQIERRESCFFLLLDFIEGEPISQFFESHPQVVWEGVECG